MAKFHDHDDLLTLTLLLLLLLLLEAVVMEPLGPLEGREAAALSTKATPPMRGLLYLFITAVRVHLPGAPKKAQGSLDARAPSAYCCTPASHPE